MALFVALPISLGLALFRSSSRSSQFFLDVYPSDPHYNTVNDMGLKGISNGCPGGNYCPGTAATRGDAAVFFVRAWSLKTYSSVDGFPNADPGPYNGSWFADVQPGHLFYRWIQKMYRLGITGGCGYNNLGQLIFCPDSPASNLQAAIFAVRTGQLTVGSPTYVNGVINDGFTNFSNQVFFPTDMPNGAYGLQWVQKLREVGTIATGCGERQFCPNNAIARSSIADYVVHGVLNEFPYTRRSSSSPNNTQYVWEPAVARGGTNWVAVWAQVGSTAVTLYSSYFNTGSHTWSLPAALPISGSILADPSLAWDATRNRYVLSALQVPQSGGPANVYFGFSNDSVGGSWTFSAIPAFQSNSQSSWDYPSIAVDGQGRIAVGAVRFSGVNYSVVSGFHVATSTHGGVSFSSPATIAVSYAPPTFNGNGAQSKLVASGQKFHVFAPVLNESIPYEIRRFESIDGGQSFYDTSPHPLASFGQPSNDSVLAGSGMSCTSDNSFISLTSVKCLSVFYAPLLDAYADPTSERWSVVVPAMNAATGRTNIWTCNSDRGCGFVNPYPYDQFMETTTLTNDGSFWVSYVSFTPGVTNAPSNVFRQVIRFPPGSIGVGMTTSQGTATATWTPQIRCNFTSCLGEGDYARMVPGFDASTVVAPLSYQAGLKNDELFTFFLTNPAQSAFYAPFSSMPSPEVQFTSLKGRPDRLAVSAKLGFDPPATGPVLAVNNSFAVNFSAYPLAGVY
ncbi:MAG: hypothetical protein IT167_29305 [Bryobacterales bacterium]|nr:hypothetical protein [Bryobacterales bacterium]